MKVLLTGGYLTGGAQPAFTGWLAPGSEYVVVSVMNDGRGPAKLQLVDLDGIRLAWFEASAFLLVESAIPEHWVASLGDGGLLELGPPAWLELGFWESYYDDEPEAVNAVRAELDRL